MCGDCKRFQGFKANALCGQAWQPPDQNDVDLMEQQIQAKEMYGRNTRYK